MYKITPKMVKTINDFLSKFKIGDTMFYCKTPTWYLQKLDEYYVDKVKVNSISIGMFFTKYERIKEGNTESLKPIYEFGIRVKGNLLECDEEKEFLFQDLYRTVSECINGNKKKFNSQIDYLTKKYEYEESVRDAEILKRAEEIKNKNK